VVCIQNIAYRTACPAGSLKSTGGVDCHDVQVKMCKSLKTATADAGAGGDSGLGIDSINDPEADNALKNCDTNGLSVAMFDKIEANKCANYSRTAGLGNATNGHADQSDERASRCGSEVHAFDAYLADMSSRLYNLMPRSGSSGP
jgi:hypothetical protein